jgi:hypothetical protein
MNGIKYLLDTNITIGFLKRSDIILDLFQSKKIKLSECAYSSITKMELLSYSILTMSEKEAIISLLTRMVYLAITPEIENETIEFRSRYKTKVA